MESPEMVWFVAWRAGGTREEGAFACGRFREWWLGLKEFNHGTHEGYKDAEFRPTIERTAGRGDK